VRRIVFRPEAEDEVLEVRQWYESRRVGLGSEFAQATHLLVERLSSNPLAFPRVNGEIRRAVFTRFPYAIYFRLVDSDVVVLAVHGRQHESRWQNRT
jgi:plasmid stabilization system protein ParE